jgi:hypothetical protein
LIVGLFLTTAGTQFRLREEMLYAGITTSVLICGICISAYRFRWKEGFPPHCKASHCIRPAPTPAPSARPAVAAALVAARPTVVAAVAVAAVLPTASVAPAVVLALPTAAAAAAAPAAMAVPAARAVPRRIPDRILHP